MSEALGTFVWHFLSVLVVAWVFYNIGTAGLGELKPYFSKPRHFGDVRKRVCDPERFDEIVKQAMVEVHKRKVMRYLPALVFAVGMSLTLASLTFVPKDEGRVYELAITALVILIGIGLAGWAARKLEIALLSPHIAKLLRDDGNAEQEL